MGSKSTKVFDLASANITKKDSERELESLKRTVRNNHNQWNTDLNSMQNDVDNAQDAVNSLISNPNATASDCLSANRNLRLAEKNLAEVKEIMDARF